MEWFSGTKRDPISYSGFKDPFLQTFGTDIFQIQCSWALNGTNLGPQQTSYSGVDSCIQNCINTSPCIAATGNYQSCYLLSDVRGYTYNNNATKDGAFAAWNTASVSVQPTSILTTSSISATSSTTPSTNPSTTPSASSSNSSSASTNSLVTTTFSSTPGATGGSGSTSISTSPTSSPTIVSSSGVSPGAVAGAAIGAALGAALIAFILTFFLCRRKRLRNESSPFVAEKSTPAHPWEAFLPQSADDNKIANSVSTLCSQIDLHVENYYGNNFQPAMLDRSRGYLAMVDSGRLQGPVHRLLTEARDPLPIIKHCFAWFILNKLSPASSHEDALLPAEYGQLPPRLTSSRGRRGEDKAAGQAYNYWRVLTAYLMYPAGEAPSRGNDLGPAGTQTIDVLTTAFAPWAKSAKAGQEHLSSVMRSASETGLLILSQSSSFVFEWDVLREDDGSSVVVSPAFAKTADENGSTLPQRQVLVKPKVEEIG